MSVASGVDLDSAPRVDPERFLRQPDQVLDQYRAWKACLEKARPHAGHAVLRQLRVRLVTLNTDGLLQKAGCSDVLELHGNVWRDRCQACGSVVAGSCPCGGPCRPDVVWEHEPLPQEVAERAFQWAEECDCLVCVGTSGRQLPAGQLPLRAREAGAYLIEINPQPTAISELCHECWRGGAEVLLARLLSSQQ